MTTVGELIKEKKDNFSKFLEEALEDEEVIKNISESEITIFKDRLSRLKAAGSTIFIFFITKELLPAKGKLDDYVNTFLKNNGINEDSILLDNEKLKDGPQVLIDCKDKIKKYLQLFIDIVEYSFE